ncbi:similar to Saccharomyces cerevisiae YKL125W RRN3 Protein required for transcription of rDNA by RNA polymerase I [Maudiozyma barnettii]|uniref:Similar to Saccharomyces cerevisiae YKL125W RRN3 Protein required for transcription of rDNA by RNA polymerase I n=1 Tax=Maudiozyma barnettii TaxID=61262 RepID=A0A8H2VK20_9SACH|nr:rDNA-binding RNA polymerase I transcriptional factor [Kazachstania barnettii]CAB4257134.1 similar to Saccharomyces cerevisiae YKL125W RRN3 Protein required for transcription of rDNA by RNA polymerase I [Kazachstania barnettii]CAD1779504.1 similar to Saccharomyces cerevisiae YKL125W RRN3 Protein required for transcription of rDNA by RNA polymerase I [Kazachstania barnettii]
MMAFENNNKRVSQDIPSPTDNKKRKVQFSNDITLHTVPSATENQDIDEFTIAMFGRFVKSGLEDLDNRNNTKINEIANRLSLPAKNPDRMRPQNMNILLDTLSGNVSRVESSRANHLIQSIINFEKWWELPDITLSKYCIFIKILCSSIPKWWQDIAMTLITSFTLSPETCKPHHTLLQYFLRMIPSSMNFMDSYLAKFFPNKNDSTSNLVNYISNLLQLTTYCKELRFQVWSLIIEKIISLDVELQNELDEMDDDVEDGLEDDDEDDDVGLDDSDNDDVSHDISNNNDDDDSSSDSEEENALEDDEEYVKEVSLNIKDLTAKIDSILTLLSGSIAKELTPQNMESGDGVVVFNILTTLFKTHVLPTYFTKSIQYVMFMLSQQQPELMDSFLVTLIDISFSPNETSEKKIKSLQYLGSYIARARKLSRTQIIFVASYLTSWLNRYVIERESEVDEGGGMDRFKHFYAAFQSLCYIFCFRRTLFRDVDGSWECELDKFFQRMIISKFNPLKYCNENVMLMFARITQHEDIAYCFSIIENNNNERLRGIIGKATVDNSTGKKESSPSLRGANSAWSLATRQQFIDLQSYFPFDPLFLKNYKKMVQEYYIEWTDVSGDYESDESDD